MPGEVKYAHAAMPGIEPGQFEAVTAQPEEPAQRVLFLPTEFSEVRIPLNDQGQMLTPVEVSTGVPLAIAPSEKYQGKNKNRHHTFFYAVDYINGTPGQQATRLARLQRVNKILHRHAHEHLFGTLMPATAEEEYRQTILGYAGYVPRFGINLEDGGFGIVELSQNQLNALRRRNTFSVQRGGNARAQIGQFLMNYAIWQDFGHEKQREIEEFLEIKPSLWHDDPIAQERKIKLAASLLDLALQVSVEPIKPTYEEARKNLFVKIGAPLTAAHVVKEFVKDHLVDYVDALDFRLRLDAQAV